MQGEAYSEDRIERMLDQWGRDYCFDWIELLGHQGKNVLYDLIRFQGRIPISTGYAPMNVSVESDRVERVVGELFAINPGAATCLRLLYCARGTVKDKSEMAGDTLNTKVSPATFKTMVRMGRMYLWGAFNARRAA